MTITNAQSGTRIDEISDGIYQIHTPIREMPGGFGFSFNQYLVIDDEPLLFHTGPRRLFPLVREAIAHVCPVDVLRWIGLSHVEADESGAINEFLAAAPRARPVCSTVAALVSMNDLADREPRALGDGERMTIGRKRLRWLDAPHFPHAWECGYLFEETSSTLFCGDLFTQPGAEHSAITEGDILGPSEAFRHAMDYFSHTTQASSLADKLAATQPRTLACMHGAAWRGDGAKLLRGLKDALAM
jgi:flavorubredoxin